MQVVTGTPAELRLVEQPLIAESRSTRKDGLSFDRLQHLVGAKAWPVLRTVGLNYIAFAFAVDFVRYPVHVSAEYLIGYLPFIVFSVGGPILRLAALAQRAGHRLNNRLRA